MLYSQHTTKSFIARDKILALNLNLFLIYNLLFCVRRFRKKLASFTPCMYLRSVCIQMCQRDSEKRSSMKGVNAVIAVLSDLADQCGLARIAIVILCHLRAKRKCNAYNIALPSCTLSLMERFQSWKYYSRHSLKHQVGLQKKQ